MNLEIINKLGYKMIKKNWNLYFRVKILRNKLIKNQFKIIVNKVPEVLKLILKIFLSISNISLTKYNNSIKGKFKIVR